MVGVIEAFRADDVRAAEAPLLAAERGFSGGLMHRAATALDLGFGDVLEDELHMATHQ